MVRRSSSSAAAQASRSLNSDSEASRIAALTAPAWPPDRAGASGSSGEGRKPDREKAASARTTGGWLLSVNAFHSAGIDASSKITPRAAAAPARAVGSGSVASSPSMAPRLAPSRTAPSARQAAPRTRASGSFSLARMAGRWCSRAPISASASSAPDRTTGSLALMDSSSTPGAGLRMGMGWRKKSGRTSGLPSSAASTW